MEDEILQEEIQTVSDNQAVVLEGQEDLTASPEHLVHNTESGTDSGEQAVEPNHEILTVIPSVSDNSVSGNDISADGSGSSLSAELLYHPVVYSMESVQQTFFFESNIDELSSTGSMLFLILCFCICIFVHGIFKGSHWFRKL